jgi:hypothetical protein
VKVSADFLALYAVTKPIKNEEFLNLLCSGNYFALATQLQKTIVL